MVSTVQPRVRVRDREDKERQLIAAAIAVFSERGYEKATTREVSERARCAEGLIYKYFGGKRQLLFAALASKSHKPRNDERPHNSTLEEAIRVLLQRRIDRTWEDREFMKVCVSLASTDPELAKIMDNLGQEAAAQSSAYLLQLVEAGLLDPETDIESTACIIGGLMLGMGYFGRVVFERDKQTIDAQIALVVKQLCRGLAPKP